LEQSTRSPPELQRSQQALTDGQSLLAAILSSVPDAMIMIDEKGAITSFNKIAQKLFGYSEAEVLGHNVTMLMGSPHREAHDGYLERYLRTGEKRIIGIGRIVEAQRRDGTMFPMELSVGEAVANGHRIFTGFIRDLTERFASDARVQELQSELAHASRLSAMGSLASTLAHELNQPLTAVANYMAAARDMLEEQPTSEFPFIYEALDEAAKESVRAGQIVRRLRDFVSKGDMERMIVPIGRLIGDATTLGLVGAREKGVNWTIDIDDVGDVVVDRVQVQQVLINLMRNAIDAMEKSKFKQLDIRASNTSDRMVEISIADTGSGLDSEVLAQLFQPFVSTKATGMGLGLSICRTIVEAHGGQISAEPNPGGGTVFRFSLNRAERENSNES
jgi:two-component system, LuxR family, sensor kinase FixL